MNRLSAIIAATILSGAICLAGEPENYYCKQITSGDGLTQPSVTAMLTDSKGSLWIGTRYCLNRYVNGNLNSFSADDLSGTYVRFIHEDSKGRIWTGTEAGVSVYDRKSGRFSTVIEMVADRVCEIDNVLYFIGGSAICSYDTVSDAVIDRVPLECSLITSALPISKDDILLVEKSHGLYIYNLPTKHASHIYHPELDGKLILSARTFRSKVWLAVYLEGLYTFDIHSGILEKFENIGGNIDPKIIYDFAEVDGKLIIGTDGDGVCMLDGRKIEKLKDVKGFENTAIVPDAIVSLYIDPLKNIWIGTSRDGMFGLKPTNIREYGVNPDGKGLSYKTISAMHQESGILWIGTDGGGINSFDPETSKFTVYPSTGNGKTISICSLDDKRILYSSYCEGIFILDKVTGARERLYIVDRNTDHAECFSGSAPFLKKLYDGRIMIVAEHPYIYDPDDGSFHQCTSDDRSMESGMHVMTGNADDMVYAVSSNSIYEIDIDREHLTKYFSMPTSARINTAVCMGRTILIGADDGLWSIDTVSGDARHLSEVFSRRITFLIQENDENVWVASGNMMFRYSLSRKSIETVDESVGFSANEILAGCNINDMLFLGGTQGLVQIGGIGQALSDKGLDMSLSRIEVDGKTITSVTGPVKLPWNYSSATIHYDINGSDPFQKILCRYEIESKSNKTAHETFSPDYVIPSLDRGTYIIRAYFLDDDGKWADCETTCKLKVSAPFYRSLWFYLLIGILMAAAASLFIIRFRKRNQARIEAEIREQNEEEKNMRIKFLVNVSHELRTPLTLIYAPLRRMLEGGNELPDNSRDTLKKIFTQASHMKDVINMVLDMDKLNGSDEPIRKVPVKIEEWVKDVSEEFRDEMTAAGIDLNYDVQECGTIWFDKWMCRMVLSNYLMNAIKYCPSGSHVTVSARKDRDGFIKVSVSDDGPGLGNINPEKLFARFAMGSHDKFGNGIGLSYSKKLIQLHNGTVGAFNNPVKGSTFYFELPIGEIVGIDPEIYQIKDNGNQAYESYPETPPEIDLGSVSVLVVDDNPQMLEYLQESLLRHIGRVLVASNGKEGIETVKTNQPDIIISDVMMPEMDGFEFCRTVKSDMEVSHIPVVLLTARANEGSVICGYKNGADSYLTKPFEDEMLLTIIKNILISRQYAKSRFSAMEHASDNRLPLSGTFSSTDEVFLTRLNELINDNISRDDLDITFLCTELAMSRSSLYNKVKAITGIGVNEYINKLRLRKSKDLLEKSEMNITEISECVGFNTQRYFSSTFKKSFGMTPMEWRKSNKQRG